MLGLTFVPVGALGSINNTISSADPSGYPVSNQNTFLANDAAVTSAWASITASGTVTDGNGVTWTVQAAEYYSNVYLDVNGAFASGDLETGSTDGGIYINPNYPPNGETTLNIDNTFVNGSYSGTFHASGAATLGSTLALTGAATLSSTLAVTGASTLTGNVSAGGTLSVTSTSTLTGDATFGGHIKKSAASSLTAHAGGGQGSGTALAKDINEFTTVGTAGDSATLPASAAGLTILVINNTATSMNVFPNTGDTINALSANTALAVAANTSTAFNCAAAGGWFSK